LSADELCNYASLTVQPIKLPGKQVKILSDQFPFWICSDIRHWGRVTWPDESSEVQVTRSVASKHEGRSESEHVVEASLLKDEDGKPVVRRR